MIRPDSVVGAVAAYAVLTAWASTPSLPASTTTASAHHSTSNVGAACAGSGAEATSVESTGGAGGSGIDHNPDREAKSGIPKSRTDAMQPFVVSVGWGLKSCGGDVGVALTSVAAGTSLSAMTNSRRVGPRGVAGRTVPY